MWIVAAQNGRRGAAGAALDVLLTDAAVGNPIQRKARQPGSLARTALQVGRRPDRLARLRRSGVGEELVLPPARAGLPRRRPDGGQHDDAHLDWRSDTVARLVAQNVHDLLAPTNFVLGTPRCSKRRSTKAARTSSRACAAPGAT